MNLDIVMIDQLDPTGRLITYRATPARDGGRVLIDRIRDIDRRVHDPEAADIGNVRIYNSARCEVSHSVCKPASFRADPNMPLFFIRFEHMGIPVGKSSEGHGGVYGFLLPVGWRCRTLYVSDPYDKTQADEAMKKQFRRNVLWDPETQSQVVEIELRSNKGSFSFFPGCSASLVRADPPETVYVEAEECENTVSACCGMLGHLDRDARGPLLNRISQGANWLHLKPNLFGLGLDLNKILGDMVARFQRKILD